MTSESTVSSDSSYDIDNFMMDALGDENYSVSEVPSTHSVASTLSCCDDEMTPTSSSEDEEQSCHTISSYRAMINKRRKKIRPSLMSSLNSFRIGEEQLSPYSKEKKLYEKLKMLSKEVDTQLCIMNQTSKVLEICKKSRNPWSQERVQTERILLLSVLRLNALFDETQRLKFEEYTDLDTFLDRGSICISNISVQLKDNFVKDTLTKNSDTVTWFMCALQHKNCVFGTQVVSNIENGQINFAESFTFNELQNNFKIKIQVMALTVEKENLDDTSKCFKKFNKPRRIFLHSTRKINDSSLLSTSSNILSTETEFNVTGVMELSKYDFYHSKPWKLEKTGQASPLIGTINFQLTSSLKIDAYFCGFLTMFEEVGGFGNWDRRWFLLSEFTLKYWNYPSESDTKQPFGVIDLQYNLTETICPASINLCPRPRTMLIDVKCDCVSSLSSGEKKRHLLSADTMAELENWCKILNYVISCLRDWNLMKT